MALNGDLLGTVINTIHNDYNDVSIAPGDLPAKRLEMDMRIGNAIVYHIQTYGEGKYQLGTLRANANPVTDVVPNNTSIKIT